MENLNGNAFFMSIHNTFTESIISVHKLKQVVESTRCPSCSQTTLKLNKYVFTNMEYGNSQVWGADISCSNCRFNGEVNSEGFSFSKVDGLGKAIKK